MHMSKKVLIVDDEEDVLIYLSAFFKESGFETATANDGKQAFSMAKSEKPQLITLDMTMPEQSGIKTYRILKGDKELTKIPVIFITAIGDSVEVIVDQLDGFPEPEGFIGKPIDHDKLEQMAKELVANE